MIIPDILIPVISFLIAFLIAYFVIPPLITIAIEKKIHDEPNYRKIHKNKTPRLGGAAILSGIIIAFALCSTSESFSKFQFILISALILFFAGLKDDVIGISSVKKFSAQFIAAFITIYLGDVRITSLYGIFGIELLPYWVSVILSLFVVIGITNALNLIDGIDGLAGGLGFIICMSFGLWLFDNNEHTFSILAFSAAGGLLAFLRYNFFSPAKIFMGDQGALIAGFLISIIAIKFININTILETNQQANSIYMISSAPAVAVGILMVLITDTLRVSFIRIINKKSPFVADKSHLHHTLMELDLSHKQTSLVLYGVNLFFVAEVILLRHIGTIPLLNVILITAAILVLILELVRKFKVK